MTWSYDPSVKKSKPVMLPQLLTILLFSTHMHPLHCACWHLLCYSPTHIKDEFRNSPLPRQPMSLYSMAAGNHSPTLLIWSVIADSVLPQTSIHMHCHMWRGLTHALIPHWLTFSLHSPIHTLTYPIRRAQFPDALGASFSLKHNSWLSPLHCARLPVQSCISSSLL